MLYRLVPFAGENCLDVLINNAGIALIPNRTLSEDGFELTFATNHLGICRVATCQGNVREK